MGRSTQGAWLAYFYDEERIYTWQNISISFSLVDHVCIHLSHDFQKVQRLKWILRATSIQCQTNVTQYLLCTFCYMRMHLTFSIPKMQNKHYAKNNDWPVKIIAKTHTYQIRWNFLTLRMGKRCSGPENAACGRLNRKFQTDNNKTQYLKGKSTELFQRFSKFTAWSLKYNVWVLHIRPYFLG